MSAPKDGGGAFPQFSLNPVSDGATLLAATGGMTLRQWYAGQALMGWVASFAGTIEVPHPERTAKMCFDLADAMIAVDEAKS